MKKNSCLPIATWVSKIWNIVALSMAALFIIWKFCSNSNRFSRVNGKKMLFKALNHLVCVRSQFFFFFSSFIWKIYLGNATFHVVSMSMPHSMSSKGVSCRYCSRKTWIFTFMIWLMHQQNVNKTAKVGAQWFFLSSHLAFNATQPRPSSLRVYYYITAQHEILFASFLPESRHERLTNNNENP